MPVLDDIATQRQRLTERLARIDAERQKLADQIAELEAAERVLSRMAPRGKRSARRGRGARTGEDTATTAVAPKGRGRRARSDQPSAGTAPRRARAGRDAAKRRAKPELSMGDAAIRAVEALGGEVSAEQIREYLGREFGMQVRPNHLGMALARHGRAGRLLDNDGRWAVAPAQSADTEPAL